MHFSAIRGLVYFERGMLRRFSAHGYLTILWADKEDHLERGFEFSQFPVFSRYSVHTKKVYKHKDHSLKHVLS